MKDVERAVENARILVDLGGRWQEALDLLGPAMACSDYAYDAHCLASLCLKSLDQPEPALQAATTAISLRPTQSWAYSISALCLLDLGKRATALRHAQEGARISPDWWYTLSILAQCQAALFLHDEAQVSAATAVEKNPQHPVLHNMLAWVAADQLPDNELAGDCAPWDCAEEGCRRALAIDPHHKESALLLAEVLKRRHKPVEALKVYLALAASMPARDTVLKAIYFMLEQFTDIHLQWQGLQLASVNADICSLTITVTLLRVERELTEHRGAIDRIWNSSQTMLNKTRWAAAYRLAPPNPRGEKQSGQFTTAESLMPDYPIPWHMVNLAKDPIPERLARHRVQTTIDMCRQAVERLLAHRDRLQELTSLRTMGADVSLPSDTSFQAVIVAIPPILEQMAHLYNTCQTVLSNYSDGLWHADEQLSVAVHGAVVAHDVQAAGAETSKGELELTQAIDLAAAAVGAFRTLESGCAASLQKLCHDASSTTAPADNIDCPGLAANFELTSWERSNRDAWDTAEQGYRRAWTRDPQDDAAAMGLASVVRRRGRDLEALAIYLDIVRNNPANVCYLSLLRSLYDDAVSRRCTWQPIITSVARETHGPYVDRELWRIDTALASYRADIDNAWQASAQTLRETIRSLWAANVPMPQSAHHDNTVVPTMFPPPREPYQSWYRSSNKFSALTPWHLLNLKRNPILTVSSEIQFIAEQCGQAAEAVSANSQLLQQRLGAEMTEVPTGDQPNSDRYHQTEFHRILLGIPARLAAMAEIYRDCERALAQYSYRMWLVEKMLSTAIDWAKLADRRSQEMPSDPEWENEQLNAIRLVDEALASSQQAETHCALELKEIHHDWGVTDA